MPQETIADGTWFVDVDYLGVARLIACAVVETEQGLLLVDPGPTTSLGTLEQRLETAGAGMKDVHAVLLTHIHLDHAGATGSIVEKNPAVEVYVHRAGARHMVRPERLLASARRLYGEMMDALWGAFLPVPESNVHVLHGGEVLEIGRRTFDVAYTPGHAVHHVSYLDRLTGTAFVGDTAGMRVSGVEYVMPVSPPPDIDVDAWHESLRTLRQWQPERLFVTHFGPADDVDRHLDEMTSRLDAWSEEVRDDLQDGRDAAQAADAFEQRKLNEMKAHVPASAQQPYEQFGQPLASWHGLARYWRKRFERGGD